MRVWKRWHVRATASRPHWAASGALWPILWLQGPRACSWWHLWILSQFTFFFSISYEKFSTTCSYPILSLQIPLFIVNFQAVCWFLDLSYTAVSNIKTQQFYRHESWSGLPCPPPGDLPNPRIEPMSLMSPALAGRFFTASAIWEAP